MRFTPNGSGLVGAFLVGVCVCCNSQGQQLTRPMAKKLLENVYKDFKPAVEFTTAKEANCLNRAGLVRLRVGNAFGMAVNANAQIPPESKNVLTKVQFESDPFGGTKLTLSFHHPPHVIVGDVTGITGPPDHKTVEFTVTYDWTGVGLTPAALACLNPAPERKNGNFRLYDDGWRIVDQ